jgi:hypothetical protein
MSYTKSFILMLRANDGVLTNFLFTYYILIPLNNRKDMFFNFIEIKK